MAGEWIRVRLFSSPDTNAIMSSAASGHRGIASRYGSAMRPIGQILSIAIGLFCLAIFIGLVPIIPGITRRS